PDDRVLQLPLFDESVECGLDERFAIIPRVGQDLFVLNDLVIFNSNAIIVAHELDGLEGTIAQIDTPSGTGGGHDLLLWGLPAAHIEQADGRTGESPRGRHVGSPG